MNERIRELIKQATHVEEPDGLFLREVFDQAKFAELIVRECAELVETQHTWITSVAASALIRKHFGLK